MLQMPSDLQEPQVSANGLIALEKRYLLRNITGDIIETPKELFWRVASTIAQVDASYDTSEKVILSNAIAFYNLMAEMKFLPNSPTLMNAGLPNGQLSACFVLPIEDSLDSIFTSLHHAAKIFKSGGGVGFSFSHLRPKDSLVQTTKGVASGPISFLKIYDAAIEQIKQGGKRRGAAMGVLRIDHPDILDFISCKSVDGDISNFNLSVAVTDSFMQAVKDNTDYALIDPNTKEVTDCLSARHVFNKLVDFAWRTADPGIIFIDTVNEKNPLPTLGDIECCNPCGEQMLHPYMSCNLGSINLSKFVIDEKTFDFVALDSTVMDAVHFLDNVIDISEFPLQEVTTMTRSARPIGLGYMGLADTLYKLGMPYDPEDEQTKAFINTIMQVLSSASTKASYEIGAKKGGHSFSDDNKRNSALTTMAPTGTLSLIAGCSSGIEPLFALAFKKRILDGEELTEVNPIMQEYFDSMKGKIDDDYLQSLIEDVAEKGSIQHNENYCAAMKKVFVVASDISYKKHVLMQALIQTHVDNAISKTVNMPATASRKDVYNAYMLAYESKCKGVTVYRDGCKESQVLVIGNNKQSPQTEPLVPVVSERPGLVRGFTERLATGMGNMYITINEYNNLPIEVFVVVGKSGKSIAAKAEAIGRMVSLALRNSIPVIDIIKQLKGIGGENATFSAEKKGLILSIPDGIAWILEKHYCEGSYTKEPAMLKQTCPECSNEMILQEGCGKCPACGYSKC